MPLFSMPLTHRALRVSFWCIITLNIVTAHNAKFFSADASLRIGNNPVAIGHAAIGAAIAPFKALVSGGDHHSDTAEISHLGHGQFLYQTSVCFTVTRANGTKKHGGVGAAFVLEIGGCPQSGFHINSMRYCLKIRSLTANNSMYSDASPIFAANGLVLDSDANGDVAIHPK